MNPEQNMSLSDIAVIGMSGRFPGAVGLEQFWDNLCQGREGIRIIADDELLRLGVDSQVVGASDYVKAVADVRGVEFFDNGFFGFTPRDAEIMDPQLRLLLECAWSTIEHAGYNVDEYRGAIGVYAGAAPNSYFIENLIPNQELMRALAGPLSSLAIYTASDALSTMVSFKLNLRGPSITVQTACSTSLVAVHLACQSLLSRESDMVLAGGVNLNIPQERGYIYQKGMILSPDGHCRPFDANAGGTLFGGGVGLVLLKRLADALADGDCIHAVIKGSAINNDGATKAGFTAPSVVGQSAAIADALAIADVPADSISYVEAHGTGTALGDPIEVEALTRAFKQSTGRNKYCGIGSVKSNIGHLDRAAGVASLIKTVLALKRGQIPATLHFKQPNPNIDFDATPFYVVDKLTEWQSDTGPRRAVVNSVGFGGTNACVVLEEPPPVRSSGASRPYQLLSLSARTESALDEATQNLVEHLERHPAACLGDVSYTMHLGRRPFDLRRVAVCRDVGDATKKLTSREEKGVFTGRRAAAVPSVVFMFPGQGAQYAGMGAELYRSEPGFRAEVDRCIEVLQPILKSDLRTALFPAPGLEEAAGQQLMQTRFTQPALFVIEYALAKLWMSWGIQPAAMIGHSVGEYVVACLAGVFTLEDALSLVAERAALVQAQPSGAMLSVRLPERDVLPLLNSQLAIAAINSPNLCVVSGPHDAIGGLEKQLESRGVMTRRLHTSHAFHSPMMEPVLAPFSERLRRVKFNEPRIPYVSNVTAAWITAKQATSPEYWAGHVRQTVRFADGLTVLCGDGPRLFLEVGPGQTLSQMVRQHPAKRADTVVLASLNASRETSADTQAILEALGKAWIAGAVIDWRAYYSNEVRHRVPLPTYPFERKAFWVDPPRVAPTSVVSAEMPQGTDGSMGGSTEKSTTDRRHASRHGDREVEQAVPLRSAHIAEELRGILEELSGLRLADADGSTTFLELGFDSLFLAQFSRRLETEFGVSVNFNQLAEELPTLRALAGHLDRELSPGATVGLRSGGRAGAVAGEAVAASRPAHIAERLLQILEGLSGISQADLTRSATFLEMGFDSLFLAGLSRKLEAEFGVSVKFGELADAKVEDLARHLDEKLPPGAVPGLAAQPRGSADPSVGIGVIDRLQEEIRVLREQVEMLSNGRSGGRPQNVECGSSPVVAPAAEAQIVKVPMTAGQREIWLASHMGDNASRAYNEVVVIRLRGSLDVGRLEASLQDLVDRHDSLRITIAANGEQQFIHPKRRQDVALIDLSAMTMPERESRVREITDRHNRTLFDLVNGPLMKAHLVRLSADDHVLHLAFHHVVIDGWSTHVVVAELSRLYSDRSRGGASDPLPSMQYRDYVNWYYRPETSKKRAQDEDYWLKLFSDLPAAVELPSKGPRPMQRSYRAGNANIAIDEELYRRLKKVSAGSSSTLFHFLLATFTVWLGRITGQNDIVVGVPIAGQLASNLQHITGCERLVGHCANVVPIRLALNGAARFVDLLADVKKRVLSARAHEGFTYGELIEKLNPPRDPSRVPFVSVTLNLNDEPSIHWDELKVDVEVPPLSNIFFDLEINIWESSKGLRIACYYADDLVDVETVKCWLSQWKTLMLSAAETPVGQLAGLEVMGIGERERLLVEWNRTAAEFPRHSCVQQLFEAQVARAPERTAVKVGSTVLSYAELNGRATRIARALRSRGVGRGQRVGLCVERGADMLAAVLGILKAGAAYVPLDPAFPQERLRFMAEDAQLALLVSSSALASTFGLHRERQLLLDTDAAVLTSQSDQELSPDSALDARPEDPAYVIYTSGSTGKPKGVVVPHRAVVNFLTSMAREPGLGTDDVLVAVTTLSFDIAVLELQLPLTLGAAVVIANRDEAIDGRALSAVLEQHRATVMQATPVTWRLLLEAGWKGAKDFKALVGGEALPKNLADQLIARGIEVWNMYGPTETTVWSTCARIADTANGITIGKPIANTTVYVLDAEKNLCPIGVPGELCIGGEGVTLGYWNRPELSAERFIPDLFSTTPGATLYRTGDRVRWRNEGTLEHLGRLDFQVKIRGYRIELGEIETAIARHPALRETVVIVREDVLGDPCLVAYLVTEKPPADLVDQLRAQLRAVLPEYMVPSAFVVLDTLPLTPNGKVDRKLLPAPDQSAIQRDGQFAAPVDSVEIQIAEIWEELLNFRPIGIRDNFFHLGGHSLLAVQMMHRVEETLKQKIALATVFENPTIKQLARALVRQAPIEEQESLRAKRLFFLRRPFRAHRRALKAAYYKVKGRLIRLAASYTPDQLEEKLRELGIASGDAVFMHSSFNQFNGFQGNPDQLIDRVLNVIGPQGHLFMVSTPYTGTSYDYLMSGEPFDVRRTISKMGIVSEAFRSRKHVLRSCNPLHPVLAWGLRAGWIVSGHDQLSYSCGPGSPFEKILELDTKVLFFDVGIDSLTFGHYLEDRFKESTLIQLYRPTPLESVVIDENGKEKHVSSYVFAQDASRRQKFFDSLEEALERGGFIAEGRIGNTKLRMVRTSDALACAERIVARGIQVHRP